MANQTVQTYHHLWKTDWEINFEKMDARKFGELLASSEGNLGPTDKATFERLLIRGLRGQNLNFGSRLRVTKFNAGPSRFSGLLELANDTNRNAVEIAQFLWQFGEVGWGLVSSRHPERAQQSAPPQPQPQLQQPAQPQWSYSHPVAAPQPYQVQPQQPAAPYPWPTSPNSYTASGPPTGAASAWPGDTQPPVTTTTQNWSGQGPVTQGYPPRTDVPYPPGAIGEGRPADQTGYGRGDSSSQGGRRRQY